jgi:hypothetical protein
VHGIFDGIFQEYSMGNGIFPEYACRIQMPAGSKGIFQVYSEHIPALPRGSALQMSV